MPPSKIVRRALRARPPGFLLFPIFGWIFVADVLFMLLIFHWAQGLSAFILFGVAPRREVTNRRPVFEVGIIPDQSRERLFIIRLVIFVTTSHPPSLSHK